jgi:hypothetical protein
VDRGDLTDAEWAVIGPLLPPERGRGCRPAHDNRRFLNGMLYVLRTGCPWRGDPGFGISKCAVGLRPGLPPGPPADSHGSVMYVMENPIGRHRL